MNDLPKNSQTDPHGENIRGHELMKVIDYLKPGQTVLEIGAGAGWQARIMAERGMQVIALDVEDSTYKPLRVWPVITYDGARIPLPDGSVDIIFSSNVLEHVLKVRDFQDEMKRVIRPGGLAIHILPTSTWRLWHTVSWYPLIVRKALWKVIELFNSGQEQERKWQLHNRPEAEDERNKEHNLDQFFLRAICPPRHGMTGNSITEFYYFSCYRWVRLFRSSGWQLERVFPNQLFYTGHRILGKKLGLKTREKLSYLLGSSCLVYVMSAEQ